MLTPSIRMYTILRTSLFECIFNVQVPSVTNELHLAVVTHQKVAMAVKVDQPGVR